MSSPKYNKSILNLYNNEDTVLARGFVPLANTIHLYKDELELTWKEIGLITSVLSSVFQNKPIIKDKDLSPDGKTENEKRSFRRQRNSLKEKGYLETAIIKDYDNGFRTLGIKYDFSGLWIKIKELVVRDEKISDENIEKPKEENNSSKSSSTDTTSPHLRCTGSEAALCVQSNRSHSGQKSNSFLQEYNKLHKEIVGFEINYEHQILYKKYILQHYQTRNRELSEIGIDEIKQAYNHHCLKSPKENKSLSFQDSIKYLLLIFSQNKNNTKNYQSENKNKPKNKTTRKVKTLDEVLDEYNLNDDSSTARKVIERGKEQNE